MVIQTVTSDFSSNVIDPGGDNLRTYVEPYVIQETEVFDDGEISSDMFGSAGNYTDDIEFVATNDDRKDYVELLKSMNISNLRYPGGSTTEQEFTNNVFDSGEWLSDPNNPDPNHLYLDELFDLAADIDASVNLVLPTRVAFVKSAGQAMAANEYGNREEIRKEYWDTLDDFIDAAVEQANANGVEIRSIEIGNEFWGSGEMTATEYGKLAGEIVLWLDEKLDELGVDVDIAVQGVSSANEFSPRAGSTLDDANRLEFYLVEDGLGRNGETDYEVFATQDDAPTGAQVVTVSDNQGSAQQIVAIAQGILAAENSDNISAADLIDGLISHTYFDGGFGFENGNPLIDGERDYALGAIFDAFSQAVGRTDLDSYASEWSSRSNNHTGLESIQTTVEAFFELVSNGVDQANYWPLTFAGNVDARSLIDASQKDLTFNGVALQLTSETLVGLSATFDFEVVDDIDIHGFSSDDRLVVFAGDRSGDDRVTAGAEVSIDLSEFNLIGDYFVVSTYVGSTGSSDAIHSNPLVTFSDGSIFQFTDYAADIVEFSLGAFGTTRIELTSISSGSDTVSGRNGDDIIDGQGGDDWIAGNEGDDTLYGGSGNDKVYDGAGDDTVFGGDGTDTFYSGGGADQYDGGGSKHDGVNYTLATQGVTVDLTDVANNKGCAAGDTYTNIEKITGSLHDDVLVGDGVVYKLIGGNGDDEIVSGSRNNLLTGGNGADTFVFNTGSKTDRVKDFTTGKDILDVSGWGVTSFADLTVDDSSGNVFVSFGADSVRVDGISSVNDLTDADFVFGTGGGSDVGGDILGTSANDIIDGSFTGDLEGDVVTDNGDTIYAGAGIDKVYDGAGDDTVFGGDGTDTFYSGGGADQYDGGGSKHDGVNYTLATQGVTVDLTDVANNKGCAAGDTYTNIEKITGSLHDDVLVGDGVVYKLIGGNGDDEIVSGSRNNLLTGGNGADTFVFNTGSKTDRVKDFTTGKDILDVSGWGVTSFADLTVDDSSGNVFVSFGADSVRVDGISSVNDLTDADFVF